jgi:peptidoglycan/LPS O-acetylase OafA/YrhL/lysophospholipase L1-like esterase
VVDGSAGSVVGVDAVASTVDPVPRLGYQPGLDGLRAFAVVAVLLYHGGVGWAGGGFLGVDVFFVLSGFLITSLLVSEWLGRGRIDVVGFYGRRARRLLPALGLVLVGVVVYLFVWAPAGQAKALRGDVLATLGYATNWRLVFTHVGYFDAFVLPSPLKHTWSLAVEEQWYVVWPLLIVGLLSLGRWLRRPVLVALCATVVLCVASAVESVVLYAPGGDPSRVYYGTDTRAQELLAGAALALVCMLVGRWSAPPRWRRVVSGVGLVAFGFVVWACVTVDDRTRWLYQGGLLVFAAAVALVVLAVVQRRSVLRTVFSPAPIRWVGAISYGLYLWHWPIYVVLTPARTGLSDPQLLWLRLLVTFVVATGSYYVVERPIRERRFAPRVLWAAAGTVVAATVVGAFVATSVAPPSPAVALNSSRTPPPRVAVGPTGGPAGPAAHNIVITGDSVSIYLTFGFVPSKYPDVKLTGESALGCDLFGGLRILPDGSRIAGGFPNEPPCPTWRAQRAQWLQSVKPDTVLVLSGVWEVYDRVENGQVMPFGTPAFDSWFVQNTEAFITQMAQGGARTVLLTSPCFQRDPGVNNIDLPENSGEKVDHLNALYRQAAAQLPADASVVDLHQRTCPDGKYRNTVDGQPLLFDGVHFSQAGAEWAMQWLMPQVEALEVEYPRPAGAVAG